MPKLPIAFANHRKLLLSTAGFAAVAILIVFCASNATPLLAQSQSPNPTAAAPAFEYEVASVKPAKFPERGFALAPTPDGLSGKNVPLLYLIQSAFGVFEKDRLVGTPASLGSETYDIDAKIDAPTMDALQKLGKDQRELAWEHMLQVLMADRFKLVAHRETRDLPVYFLVVAKTGPNLHNAKPDPDGTSRPHWGGGTTMTNGKIIMVGKQMTVDGLAHSLSRPSGRTVLDKTGLNGIYDFTLEFTPDDTLTESSAPTLFKALQEQLGLKLEPGKNSVEVIVVDHVERPSGN